MTPRLAILIVGVFAAITTAMVGVFGFVFYGAGYEDGRVEGCRSAALSQPFVGKTLRSIASDGQWSASYWKTYGIVSAKLPGRHEERKANWRYILETADLYAEDALALEVFPGDGPSSLSNPRLPDRPSRPAQ